MLKGQHVLIVEDEPIIAMEIAGQVEAAGGVAIGPFAKVARALEVLPGMHVTAAVLDANLADRDVVPVALLLTAREVPFVIYTGGKLPEALARIVPFGRILRKPIASGRIVSALAALLTH